MALTHQIEIFRKEHVEKLSLFAPGTRVVIAVPKNEIMGEHLSWVSKIQALGHIPILTLPARRVKSEKELGGFLDFLQAHSLDQLVVVGGNDVNFCVFQDALGLLIYLAKQKPRLQRIFMPGHPENLKVTTPQDAFHTLMQKLQVIQAQGWRSTLISQVCLSPSALAQWMSELSLRGARTSICVGVVPSCDKQTLMLRLQLCSVVRHAQFHASYDVLDTMSNLYKPFSLIQSLAPYIASGVIEGLHWYGFDDLEEIARDIALV